MVPGRGKPQASIDFKRVSKLACRQRAWFIVRRLGVSVRPGQTLRLGSRLARSASVAPPGRGDQLSGVAINT